jgi:hypothetical protein
MRTDKHIQFGAGDCVGEHWRNFDASLSLRIQAIPVLGKLMLSLTGRSPFPVGIEYGDILHGLPIAENSAACVYCSHVLEHLSYEDARLALANSYQMLGEGGVLRLVVPDLEYYAKSYTSGVADAPEFLMATGLGRIEKRKGIIGSLIASLGRSDHLWMWDFDSLSKLLADSGFRMIRRAQFGDGADPLFREVEREARWLNCLGIECEK